MMPIQQLGENFSIARMHIKLARKSNSQRRYRILEKQKFYNSSSNNIEVIKQELAKKHDHIMNNPSDTFVGNMSFEKELY